MIHKALSYITLGPRLLVFRQPEYPEQGVQVPGGSVELGESPAQAALREAREETGLTELQLEAYLGSAEYRPQVDPGPPHLRHYFHLTFHGRGAASFRHPGSQRGGRAVWFELWWQPLASVRLDWEMGVYVSALSRNLAVAPPTD